MGSLAGESGRQLNTRAYNPKDPGKGSYGIGQWNKERWDKLDAFAKDPAKNKAGYGVDDFRTQMDFVKHELQTTEAKTLSRMKAAPDRAAATKTWTNSYERPKAEFAHHDRRIANADFFAGLAGAGPKSPMEAADAAGKAYRDESVTGATLTGYTDPVVTTKDRKADPFSSLFGNVDKAVTDVSNQFNGKGKDPEAPVNHTVDHLGDMFGVTKKTGDEAAAGDSGFFGDTTGMAMIGAVAGGMFAGPIGSVLGGLAGQGISKALDRLANYQQEVADTAVTQGAAGGTGRQVKSFFGGIGDIFSPESKAAASFAKSGDKGMGKNGFPTAPSGGSKWNGQYSSTDSHGNSWSGQASKAISDSKSKGGPQGLY